MMKQIRSTTFILTCVILFIMAGCGRKTYATLEEWYTDNPLPESETHSTYQGNGFNGTIDISIEGNELIYKCTMSEKIFGADDETDAMYREFLDSSLSQQQTSFNQIINDISLASGIDSTQISLRYEYYNPGDSTPFYSESFAKNLLPD